MTTHSITAETPIKSVDEDTLGYGDEAKQLAELLIGAQPPSMIGLYSPWGSGKSSMLFLVNEGIRNLDKDHVLPVRFNTWDHENPQGLIPTLLQRVAQEILKRAPEMGAAVVNFEKASRSLYRVAKTASIVIAGWSLKAATHGGVEMNDIMDAADFFKGENKDGDVNLAKKWMENINRDPHAQLSEDLRLAFNALAAVGIRKVVLLIDDLDRCHPENIYNFLDNLRRLVAIVENLEFSNKSQGFVGLIAADEQIISSTVRAKYPHSSADAGAYLYKLLSMTRRMPPLKKEKVIALLSARGKDDYGLDSGLGTPLKDIATAAAGFAEAAEGALTPRHLLAFLRHFAYWRGLMSDEEKNAFYQAYAPITGLALLGILDPARLKILVLAHRANPEKWRLAIREAIGYVNGAPPGEDYRNSFRRSLERDWGGFQHAALLGKISEMVKQQHNHTDVRIAAKLAGLG